MNQILWLITARCGSKSIPNKNIKLLNGQPLIAYRIKSALSIAPKENVWVSTDNDEYAEIAKENGATIPFIRPKELATDNASSIDVVLHAMIEAEKRGLKYIALGLLEPTSPFVTYKQLKEASRLLLSNEDASSIVACRETRPNSLFIQKESQYLDSLAERFKKQKQLGRQNFDREITPSGGFYIAKWEFLQEHKTFYSNRTLSYLVEPESGLEIDELIDWKYAEFLIKEKIVDVSKIYK